MTPDRRNHCRADPPSDFKGKRPITAQLDAADYRAAYEIAMQRGCSMADMIRQLIREATA